MAEPWVDVEIRIFGKEAQGYPVEITAGGREYPRGYLSADILPWVPEHSSEENGERLFNLLVQDPSLRSAWDRTVGESPRRRIHLRIDHTAPELQTLPWELMRDTTQGVLPCTLAADRNTPFSRYVAGQWDKLGIITNRPIKLLLAMANPADLEGKYHLPALDVETEEGIIRDALGHLEGEKHVEVSVLPAPVTLAALHRELGKDYHILHFVGHGRYLDEEERACLYMADEANRAVLVGDRQFAEMLAKLDGALRLVFLASCQTAVSSPQVPFRGLAMQVVAAAIPVVLAMQDLVTVKMARQLTETFYQELLSHGQVDVALNEARAAVMVGNVPGSWGIATLLSRLEDNRLFAMLDMTGEQVSDYSRAATLPSGITQNGVRELAARLAPEEIRAIQTTLGQMLAQIQELEIGDTGSEQVQIGGVQMSRIKLLLSNATLLEAEAEQMLRAHIEGNLPPLVNEVTSGQSTWQAWRPGADPPFKARVRAGLEQALQASLPRVWGAQAGPLGAEQSQQVSGYIADRLLASFDLAAYEGKINEAYALVEEARELDPENAEASLHEARLVLALHPDDPGQGQRLLYRLRHKLADPQDDEARVDLGKTLYLLAGAQQPVDPDLMRQALQLFVTAGDEELVAQAKLGLAGMLVERAKGLHAEAVGALTAHTQYKAQQ
ncbi:MAG: CHAT domain-containing protein, partial [Anaerolineae bacterium]